MAPLALIARDFVRANNEESAASAACIHAAPDITKTLGYHVVAMYAGGIDEQAKVVITIFGAGSHSDDEYERSIQDVFRIDALAAESGGAFVHFVIEDHGSQSPSARWRKRFADMGGAFRAQPYYFALVTDSPLIRGGFTAMRWLRGERPGHHLAAFSTFEQACAWVREVTGAAYPRLEALCADARARAR